MQNPVLRFSQAQLMSCTRYRFQDDNVVQENIKEGILEHEEDTFSTCPAIFLLVKIKNQKQLKLTQ